MVDKVVDAFDELAVSLSSGGSRRLIVRRLTLSALGVLGMMNLTEDDAEAAGKNGKKKKRRGKKRRPKKCPPGRKRCGKRCCGKGLVCKQGKCRKPGKPLCTPKTKAEACGDRECGNVANGCGNSISCGTCTGPDICDEATGQCDCIPPQTSEEACGARECGEVPNGCGGTYQCGPDNGDCTGTNEECSAAGVCECVPPQTQAEACGSRECGTVPDGCGGNYQCGPNDGECTGPNEQCQSGVCTCVPKTRAEACGTRECGQVPDGCGGNYQCGPNDGTCPGAQDQCIDGDCVCQPLTRAQACGDRECGEASDGCGGTYQCGSNDGICPTVACQTAVACSENGECIYETESLQGSACDAGFGPTTGMCVAGSCEATNSNPDANANCAGVNVCVGPPRKCGTGDHDCNCYSTVEGAGFCIKADEAQCYEPSVRPPCSSSAQCTGIAGHENSVCVPLKENPDSQSSCCPSGQFPGFCVPLADRCEG